METKITIERKQIEIPVPSYWSYGGSKYFVKNKDEVYEVKSCSNGKLELSNNATYIFITMRDSFLHFARIDKHKFVRAYNEALGALDIFNEDEDEQDTEISEEQERQEAYNRRMEYLEGQDDIRFTNYMENKPSYDDEQR